MGNDLVGLQSLVDVLSLTIQSSFISNEANGVSTILVGKPETAKTTTIFKFNGLRHVAYFDEITQKKLLDDFLPFVRTKQKRTLMIPDLINCTEKQKSTRDQFLNIIKSGIDDNGLVQISTAFKILSPQEIEGIVCPLKFNLISAITNDSLSNIIKFMRQTGLQSRVIFFSYDYPLSLINKIMAHVRGEKVSEIDRIRIPKIIEKDTIVLGDSELFKSFEMISTRISQSYGGYGIRSQINLQRLAKSNALINGRNKVEKVDIDKILELSNWINLERNIL